MVFEFFRILVGNISSSLSSRSTYKNVKKEKEKKEIESIKKIQYKELRATKVRQKA